MQVDGGDTAIGVEGDSAPVGVENEFGGAVPFFAVPLFAAEVGIQLAQCGEVSCVHVEGFQLRRCGADGSVVAVVTFHHFAVGVGGDPHAELTALDIGHAHGERGGVGATGGDVAVVRLFGRGNGLGEIVAVHGIVELVGPTRLGGGSQSLVGDGCGDGDGVAGFGSLRQGDASDDEVGQQAAAEGHRLAGEFVAIADGGNRPGVFHATLHGEFITGVVGFCNEGLERRAIYH